MTLIKDLIEIPDRVQKGDFVLRLSEDIEHPDVVLDNYVVTPELAKNFDAALTFIRSAVQGRTSKATYLHGSFGSGKSHFMAVLHLILQGNPGGAGDPGTGLGHPEAQRLAGRQAVPAGALPHDQRPRHGVGHPGRLRGLHPPQAPGQARPAGLHVGGDHRPGRGRAGQLRRRGVLQAAQRRAGRRGQWERLGRAGGRLGCGVVRGRRGGAAGLGAPPAPGEHVAEDRRHLARRGHQPPRRELRAVRQGPVDHQPARGRPGLRRPDPVPRRVDPLAGHELGRPGLRQPPGGQADEPGGGPIGGPARADRELRGPAAGPAGADRRARARGRAAELRRLAGLPAGPVRHDHPGGPEPAGDRREAGAAVQGRDRHGRNSTRPSSRWRG